MGAAASRHRLIEAQAPAESQPVHEQVLLYLIVHPDESLAVLRYCVVVLIVEVLEREAIEIEYQRLGPVSYYLAIFLEPEALDAADVIVSLHSPDEVQHRVFTFADADDVAVVEAVVRDNRRVYPAPDDWRVQPSLESLRDLNRPVEIVAHQREADDSGICAFLDDVVHQALGIALLEMRVVLQ